MPYLNYSMVHSYHRMNMFHGWFHIFLIIALIICNCIQTNVSIQYDKMLWITQISGITYHYRILGCLLKMSLPPDAWANQRLSSKGASRRSNFAPWNKGQWPHGALLHAVSGCCNCFQQCRIATTGSTPPVALKMSLREGVGAMLHKAKLHGQDLHNRDYLYSPPSELIISTRLLN